MMEAAPPLRAVEAFLFEEARLLDEGRFDEWLALFTDTAWYWVPSQPGQRNPEDTVSIIYDDRRLLETRVRRLMGPNMHAGDPRPRTSRIIGNVTITHHWAQKGDIETTSVFQMLEYRLGARRIFAGTCRHCLAPDGNTFRIRWKRVDLVDCDAAHEGITIPF